MRHTIKAFLLLLLTAGLLTATTATEDPGWPRELSHAKGDVVIYQPQLESLEGDMLRARAAVSVKLKEAENPVFGVIWSNSRVHTDRDARTLELLETGQ